MKKIFLDVGAHIGQTTKIALEKKYKFDKVYCFEPVKKCADVLKTLDNPRIEVCEFGFWDKNCKKPIYKPTSKSASIYRDKFRENVDSEEIELKKISEWFKENIKKDDKVYLKLNCEGAECTILDDLATSGEYKKVNVLMADFDVRKIPSQRHRMSLTKDKLRNLNPEIPKMFFIDEYKLGHGTHNYFTHFWLDESENV